MLINWAKEENEGEKSPRESQVSSGYHSHEYQTASELFQFMTRHNSFDVEAENSLTTRDLVILYENIEIGTKLLSDANQVKRRRPNQLVETVVYHDDVSDSEASENHSYDDLLHMCRTNTDTIEMLHPAPMLNNTLCHKRGNMKFKNNHLNSEYDKNFLLKDPEIKAQLQNIRLTARECENTCPISLLDYLSCKRLEDNYNIYMDNIIRYVTHTIEQLKRISNGDYLTEKAREKWREVPDVNGQTNKEKDMKVLATSTSFPLRIETKVTGLTSMWDDIVHSEMDIKSLTKILEKKLIVEVPKLICGSFTLLSKQCADNLIISCESNSTNKEDKESRVDVVLQLERSQSGQIVSNINSIMILQANPSAIPIDFIKKNGIALPFNVTNQTLDSKFSPRPLAIENIPVDRQTAREYSPQDNEYDEESEQPEVEFNDCEGMSSSLPNVSVTDSSPDLQEIISYSEGTLLQHDSPSSHLHMTMHSLDLLDTLVEEPVKKKSATKVRIKSPYANNSHAIEEKKRKKLLEIKERREKRKMAFNESCKISKNKYVKGTITPQAANSVTKLSITNKSFYNSIYGHFTSENNRYKKGRNLSKKDSIPELALDEGAPSKKNVLSPDKNSLKFIDRSYFLDDTITAMDLQKKKIPETDRKSDCPSEESSATKLLNINILSELIESFTDTMEKVNITQTDTQNKIDKLNESAGVSDSTTSAEPWSEDLDAKPRNKTIATLDCRKSIEKIYSIMNKSETTRNSSNKPASTLQPLADTLLSDSGTSLHDTKNKSSTSNSNKILIIRKEPKEDDKTRNNKTNVIPQTRKLTPDNPLKAISQLLHDFDNVKKNRLKALNESKGIKKQQEIQKDSKLNNNSYSSRRRPQTDEQIDDRKHTDRFSRSNLTRDKRVNRSTPNVDTGRAMSPKKISPHRTTSPKRNVSPKRLMSPKKPANNEDANRKLTDIIDEAKEAKGEAVKGPPRLNTARLNALAQPKKSYVVAHSEEYQSRYGRNLMADRLDRLAAATDRHSGRNRLRRFGNEPLPNTPQKTNNANQPLDIRKRSPPRTRSPAKQNPGVASARDIIKVINVEEAKPNPKRELVVPLDTYTRPTKLASVQEEHTKSRTPHVPNNWSDKLTDEKICKSQASSMTNSSEMGLMIHKLINKIINTDFVVTSCDEVCGSIGPKTESLLGTDTEDFEYPLLDPPKIRTHQHESGQKKPQKVKSTALPASTLVEYFSDSSPSHYTTYESSVFKEEDNSTASGSGSLDKELEKLENALARKTSNTTFQNRLRMKTLTLTPIQSDPQTMLVESGDAMAIQTKTSQIIDIHSIHPYETSISDAPSYRKQTQPNVSWGFTQIPMQLYTVGYAIPQYNNQIAVRRIRSNTTCKVDDTNKNLKFPLQIKKGQLTSESLPAVDMSENQNKTTEDKPKVTIANEVEIPIKIAPSKEVSVNSSESKTQAKVERCSCCDNENCRDKQLMEKKPMNQSNSLDILVGLLSEIKKLTECQNQITEREHLYQKRHENISTLTPQYCNKEQQQSVENIFNNASRFNKRDLLLVHAVETDTSLDLSGDLFRHQSLTKKLSVIDINRRTTYVDKKVSVDFINKNLINQTTGVPSQSGHITVTRSTTFTQSMIDMFERSIRSPDKRSSDSSLLCAESIKPSEKIIELQNYDYETDDSKKTEHLEAGSETAKVETDAAEEMTKTTAEIDVQTQDAAVSEVAKPVKRVRARKLAVSKMRASAPLATKEAMDKENGPVLKLKRDVLVTVYSILVITVFAALSLPDLLYQT